MKEKINQYIFRIFHLILFVVGGSRSSLCQSNNVTITTQKPAKLSYLIYQLKAEINLSNRAKQVGFCYADHQSPTVKDGKIICTQSNESNSISTIIAQNQLKKGKTYYIRAYSIIGSSILYGNEETISQEQRQFEIGQRAFGGIIAYIFEPGDKLYVKGEIHGIIAAETDLHGKYTWNTTLEANKKITTIFITKQYDEGIGNGKTNTRAIAHEILTKIQELSLASPTKLIYPSAAEVCNTLKLNSYNDWFLPSLKEMQMMWFHQTSELRLNSKTVYWTSTSHKPNKAVVFAFKETPLIRELNHEQEFAIRPMRYF
jgi:hypothetical protein